MSIHPVFSNNYLSAHIAYLESCIAEIVDKISKTSHIEWYANSYRDALSNKSREIAWVQTLCPSKDYRIGILKADMLYAQTLLQERVAFSLTQKAAVLTRAFPARKDADIRSSIDTVRAIFHAFALKINQELVYTTKQNRDPLAQACTVMKEQIKILNSNFPVVLDKPSTQGLADSLSFLEHYRCNEKEWTSVFKPSRNFAIAVAAFETTRMEELVQFIRTCKDIFKMRNILDRILSITAKNLVDLQHDARTFNLNITYQIRSAEKALRKARNESKTKKL